MRPFYELINHTGDAGAIVYGKTIEEIFINAARAMFDILVKGEKRTGAVERLIEVEGADREDLLIRWLSELNYNFSTRHEVYSKYDILALTDNSIKSKARGEPLDNERHEVSEIKAVTYHGLYLKETDDGFEARVIFDL